MLQCPNCRRIFPDHSLHSHQLVCSKAHRLKWDAGKALFFWTEADELTRIEILKTQAAEKAVDECWERNR